MPTEPVIDSWNIVGSAPQFTELAGIGTGVAFTAFILIQTRSGSANPDARRSDLERRGMGQLLLAALILSVAALEFGLIAGETNLRLLRPEAAAAFAAPTFMVGVVQLAAGICYLVIDFDRRTPTEGLPVSLMSLCEGCYVALAGLCTFFSAWVATDVVQLGIWGRPRPKGLWFGQPTAFVTTTVAVGCLISVLTERGPVSRWLEVMARRERPSWLSEWPAVGGCALLSAILVVLTSMLGTDGSQFVQAGTWGWTIGVVAYVVGLIVVIGAMIGLWVTQGWIIHQHRLRPAPPDATTNGHENGSASSYLWVVEGWTVYQRQLPQPRARVLVGRSRSRRLRARPNGRQHP